MLRAASASAPRSRLNLFHGAAPAGAYLRSHPPGGPIAFIAGTRSREVRQVGLVATAQVCQGRVSWIEGTHLFPFERPDETASAVLDWMTKLDALVSPI